ncbi:hypothetical protein ABMA28_001829 [Loxostege sticticalis]|uniref:Major facilitator superfamily (MFS) profile domain-containing protein n=1 Tax=Loxostege sticticalis TaxID=481309 RepID=A0ABD0T313_LOXSC
MEAKHENENNFGDRVTWIQLLIQVNVSLTIWCFYYIVGLSIGSPTVIIPQLIKETNSTVVMGDKLYSWITSICGYVSVCWVFILTLISHFFGRKKIMFVISVCSFGASTLVYFSRNPTHVFFSQMMYAVPGAGQMTVYAMILTEYSSTKYRGIFLALKSASFFWGIWTANAIGILSHYKYIGLLSMICSSYCCINVFFMPESPYWLAFKGKYDECTKAQQFLKGKGEKATKELEDLINLQMETRSKNDQISSTQHYISHYVNIVQQPEIYKPILLCILVFLVYHISGKVVCAVYAIEIMKDITDTESTAHIGVLILDGFSVLGMYIGCGVSKYVKRRTMLLVPSIVGTTFLLIMSLYLYLVKLRTIPDNSYIIITLLVGYSLAICCGPAIMSTSICGELFPVKARSFTICCTAAIACLLYGTIIKTSPLMFVAFDIHGTFLFFGISSVICIILTCKYLPETKDISIYEIASQFNNKDQS